MKNLKLIIMIFLIKNSYSAPIKIQINEIEGITKSSGEYIKIFNKENLVQNLKESIIKKEVSLGMIKTTIIPLNTKLINLKDGNTIHIHSKSGGDMGGGGSTSVILTN